MFSGGLMLLEESFSYVQPCTQVEQNALSLNLYKCADSEILLNFNLLCVKLIHMSEANIVSNLNILEHIKN